MPTPENFPFKKYFLYSLIGSVVVSALFGIAAILMGNFGQFEIRILITSLTISGASLCGVSCGAALEAKRAKLISIPGVGLAIISAMMIIAGIWGEFASQEYWKCTATLQIFAVACAHMSLLRLARLSERFQWATWGAYGAVFGGAIVLSSLFWGDFELEWTGRFFGVLAILASAFSIMILIFHRLSREEFTVSNVEPGPTLEAIEQEINQLKLRLAELEHLKIKLCPQENDSLSNSQSESS